MINIFHISSAIRPYERLCTTAIDFNVNGEFAAYNDKIVSRDPDKFLQTLEEETNIDDILD